MIFRKVRRPLVLVTVGINAGSESAAKLMKKHNLHKEEFK